MKKILYFSDSKFPLAGLAGAIHTDRLPMEIVPGSSELWSILLLSSEKGEDGKIISLGEDEWGNKIYALSVKGERGMVSRLVKSFLNIYNIPDNKLSLVDCKVRENYFLLLGWFLYRINIFTSLGRFFISVGVKKIYSKITCLVMKVRDPANLP